VTSLSRALARQVPPAVLVGLGQRRDHVEEQRFADRARLLRPVQHRDAAHGRRQRVDQRLGRERPVQPQLRHADPCVGLVRYVAASSAAPSQLGCGRGTRCWLINDGRRAVEAKREEIEASLRRDRRSGYWQSGDTRAAGR